MKLFGIISQKIDGLKTKNAFELQNRQNLPVERFDNDGLLIHYTQRCFDTVMTRMGLELVDPNGIQFICNFIDGRYELSMDYFGLSKIYYCQYDEEFIFSSEIKSIIEYVGRDNLTPNKVFLQQMFVFGFPIHTSAMFEEIENLPVGFKISVKPDTGDFELGQYNFVNYRETLPIKELYEELCHSFPEDSHTKFLWLSGGLDSRVILEILAKKFDSIDIITNFGHKGTMNRKYASEVINKRDDVTSTFVYEVTPEMIVNNAKEHLWISEGMSGHLNAHILATLKHFAHIPDLCIYDGFAGDIILGANHYNKVKYDFTIASLELFTNKEFLKYIHLPLPLSDIRNYCSTDLVSEIGLELFYHNNYSRNVLASGGIGIGKEFGKVIYPFANWNFFEHCMNISIEKRKNHSFYKKFLRKVFPQIDTHDSTSLRTKSIEYKIQTILRKHVFKNLKDSNASYVTPGVWFKESTLYRNFVEDLIQKTSQYTAEYFDFVQINRMNKHKDINHLVKLVNFSLMFQLFYEWDNKGVRKKTLNKNES